MAISFVIWLLVFVVIPGGIYLMHRGDAQRRWLPRAAGTTRIGDEGYRGAEVPKMVAAGPPGIVSVTAVMCWVLGMGFIPGIILSLYGLLAMGIGMIGIPGLIAAARTFAVGAPLLRADPDAPTRARAVARFVRVLNYVVLAIVALLFTAYVGSATLHGRIGNDLTAVLVLGGGTGVYALVSLLHAWLLERSAALVEEDHLRRAAEAVAQRADGGVRVDVGFAPQPSWDELAAQAAPADRERQR